MARPMEEFTSVVDVGVVLDFSSFGMNCMTALKGSELAIGGLFHYLWIGIQSFNEADRTVE